jgi:hypothetical protein
LEATAADGSAIEELFMGKARNLQVVEIFNKVTDDGKGREEQVESGQLRWRVQVITAADPVGKGPQMFLARDVLERWVGESKVAPYGLKLGCCGN